ncbi:tautomerase family protein [Gordonia sp. OPL2]|uniref:tautomerase family protein n=1 Tax=Gordonia sp. OPL2 TaxID=2486274 RepID=UPI001654FBEC|nr:tautomerase family protein [Gordonia sp. OPL2]ROZ86289.1 tautomerase family protein [Gordonia sp. OPL2]
MPLVHIHVIDGRRPPSRLRELADAVQTVMLDHFDAPDRDRYQLITEHRPGHIIAEDTGLGFERTDDIVVIQIYQQGRTVTHKQAAYRSLATELDARGLVRPDDLIISVVPNTKEDWSFGGGSAQFVEGLLS